MNLFNTNHTPLLYGNDKPSVPDNLPSNQQRGDFVRSSDNLLWLFSRQWIPPSKQQPILATLLILHGTVDHGGVYDEFATLLNKAGIAVFCTDMRGWGLSDGESYYFHHVDVFVQDVKDQYQRIQQQFPQVQHHFILGKSIGGLIAAHAVCSDLKFSGMIGLSGAFGIDQCMIPSTPVLMILNSLNKVMPKLPLKPLMPASLLVSDEAAQEQWQDDSLVRRQRLTVGYLHELLRCTGNIEETLKSFPAELPILALWGTDDEVVTKQGHELLCGKCADCATLKTYSGGRHNLLSEPQLKAQVMNDICDWIVEICKSSSRRE